MKTLNAFILFSALLAIYFLQSGSDAAFIIFKPLTTILIIGFVFLYADRSFAQYYYSVLFALLACLAGDVFLLNNDYFVFGLSAFLVGHCLFIVAFVSFGGFKLTLLPLIILAALGASYYRNLVPGLGELSIPVAVYSTVIILMVWQAISLYLWNKNGITLSIAFAAVLFMFSDSIIAMNKFTYPFAWSGTVILASYWLAITIIANTTATIGNVKPRSDQD